MPSLRVYAIITDVYKGVRLLWLLLSALTISGRTDGAVEKMAIRDIAHLSESSREIELEGTVATTVARHFILKDDTGCCCCTFYDNDRTEVRRGDVVRVHALVEIRSRHQTDYARVKSLQFLSRGDEPDPPEPVEIAALSRRPHDYRKISLVGTVTEVFLDETDPEYIFLNIEADGGSALLVLMDDKWNFGKWRQLTDRVVRAVGVTAPPFEDPRRCRGLLVMVDRRHPIVPVLESEIGDPSRFPHRRKFNGEVLALCDGQTFYLRTERNDRLKVHLEDGAVQPAVGDRVTVAGFVRSNFFYDALSNARIVKRMTEPSLPETPERISPKTLLYSKTGQFSIRPQYEGRPITLSGKVLSSADIGTPDGKINLDSDGVNVSVRIGPAEPPPMSSLVEVSGICSITAESTGVPNGFVRLTGFTLITRNADDIRVIAPPPWWTPLRLLVVIGVLILVIAAILLWNIALRAVAERRGRELMAEQIGHVSADLKVNERTRLAVELHDALSQNLTGVSLQLDAVKRFADEDRDKMTQHLCLAMRTLKSCRDELRNCLWDLRNRALEEKDLNEAIRRTASPFVGEAQLLIRFNVPRDQISDNTAHALMRIVRELATNAVRHGGAKTIRIAGALENGRLLFSVNDDGRGFDPERHPGVNEGHFGLDGIRDRVSRFNGTLEIESTPDRGATIRIAMTA